MLLTYKMSFSPRGFNFYYYITEKNSLPVGKTSNL